MLKVSKVKTLLLTIATIILIGLVVSEITSDNETYDFPNNPVGQTMPYPPVNTSIWIEINDTIIINNNITNT